MFRFVLLCVLFCVLCFCFFCLFLLFVLFVCFFGFFCLFVCLFVFFLVCLFVMEHAQFCVLQMPCQIVGSFATSPCNSASEFLCMLFVCLFLMTLLTNQYKIPKSKIFCWCGAQNVGLYSTLKHIFSDQLLWQVSLHVEHH